MLTDDQYDEFERNGFIILKQFLPEESLKSLEKAIDQIQGEELYDAEGRWNKRNCLPHDPVFIQLLANEKLASIAVQLVEPIKANVKLIGSHAVKMQELAKSKEGPIGWHQDGGILILEEGLLDARLFIKFAFCISGSLDQNGGELLVVPGSHHFTGDELPANKTGQPYGSTRVMISPGDVFIFDWRLWHAVTPNQSSIIRRTLYYAFGHRWLMPLDVANQEKEMGENSPAVRQLLGWSTELGNYLPLQEDTPLKPKN